MPEAEQVLPADLAARLAAAHIVVAGYSHLVPDHPAEDSPTDLLGEGSRPDLVVDPVVRHESVSDRNLLGCTKTKTNISTPIGLLVLIRRLSIL